LKNQMPVFRAIDSFKGKWNETNYKR
jgi:hypothetical protein